MHCPALRPSQFLIAFTVLLITPLTLAADWQAGVSRIEITPTEPLWMSGYASRTEPAQGTLHPIWAKAVCLQADDEAPLLLISLDLVGIDRELSRKVCQRIQQKWNLERSQIALCCSHTHTGPVVGTNLLTMYFIDENAHQQIAKYTDWLEDQIVNVANQAIEDLHPAEVSYDTGTTTFAVNRRNNREADVPQLREEKKLVGPVDHEVPVLKVAKPSGEIEAILFGYACHATVLSLNQWSGDWPGFAQIAIEKQYPEATALFFAGCGGDQNPLPRRTVELAEKYGDQIASAVDKVLKQDMPALPEKVQSQYEEIDLSFAHIPDAEELAQDQQDTNRYVASRARHLVGQLETAGSIPATYPYPIQMWSFGKEFQWVILGGEVTVEYSLNLKQMLPAENVWVAGYSNDVMAYIPSSQILKEGGYEGERSMVYYGLPSPWKTGTEKQILTAVKELAAAGESDE